MYRRRILALGSLAITLLSRYYCYPLSLALAMLY